MTSAYEPEARRGRGSGRAIRDHEGRGSSVLVWVEHGGKEARDDQPFPQDRAAQALRECALGGYQRTGSNQVEDVHIAVLLVPGRCARSPMKQATNASPKMLVANSASSTSVDTLTALPSRCTIPRGIGNAGGP